MNSKRIVRPPSKRPHTFVVSLLKHRYGTISVQTQLHGSPGWSWPYFQLCC